MQPKSETQTQRMQSQVKPYAIIFTYNLPINSSVVRKSNCSDKRKSNLITSAASDRGLTPGPPNAGPPLTKQDDSDSSDWNDSACQQIVQS